jgi:hypothetical protein
MGGYGLRKKKGKRGQRGQRGQRGKKAGVKEDWGRIEKRSTNLVQIYTLVRS